MADDLSPEEAETRAARRLRCVGFLVTIVWLDGLGVYVWGLASTDTGLRWPRFDPDAWRENVGFLVDWTSLIGLSGSFIALLWWPKHVVETIANLWARHRDRLIALLRDLIRSFAQAPSASSRHDNEPVASSSGLDVGSSAPEAGAKQRPQTSTPQQPVAVDPNPSSATPQKAARRRTPWARTFVVIAVVVVVGLLLQRCTVERPQPPDQGPEETSVTEPGERGNNSNRTYVMREGDGRGAVEAITRGISDPLVRARCTEALERDPMNRPPQDRRQRPGHAVPLPDECPTP
jgi:hypothetical protein